MYQDFTQHGAKVIEDVRVQRPADYLKIVAGLLPKDLHIKETNPWDEWTRDELAELIATIRAVRAQRTSGAEDDPQSQH